VYYNQKRACFAYVHFVDTRPTAAATNIPTTPTGTGAPGTADDLLCCLHNRNYLIDVFI